MTMKVNDDDAKVLDQTEEMENAEVSGGSASFLRWRASEAKTPVAADQKGQPLSSPVIDQVMGRMEAHGGIQSGNLTNKSGEINVAGNKFVAKDMTGK